MVRRPSLRAGILSSREQRDGRPHSVREPRRQIRCRVSHSGVSTGGMALSRCAGTSMGPGGPPDRGRLEFGSDRCHELRLLGEPSNGRIRSGSLGLTPNGVLDASVGSPSTPSPASLRNCPGSCKAVRQESSQYPEQGLATSGAYFPCEGAHRLSSWLSCGASS